MSNNLTIEDKLDFLIKFVFESTPRRSFGIFVSQLELAARDMNKTQKEELSELLGLPDDLRNEMLR